MSNRTPPFARHSGDRVLVGVAGGLARALGVDPLIVRIGFVLTAFAGGIGVLIYAAGYFLGGPPVADASSRRVTTRHAFGFASIVAGICAMVASVDGLGAVGFLLPITLALIGSAVVAARVGESGSRRVSSAVTARNRLGNRAGVRLVIGIVILVAGIGIFLLEADALASVRSAVLAVGATAVGVALLLGPWLARLGRDVSTERFERMRSEERAEMSAHLHDSVLHTLALIQRSEAPADVVTLARRQERELRTWMQGRTPLTNGDAVDLRAAIEAVADRVEQAHQVVVDAVVVGDRVVDDRLQAFLQALQEAVVNAARHAEVARLSVYVEADDESGEVVAYVRDQGIGFDLAAVPADRRGIADSIEGRLRRLGGRATITSAPGAGTEVELRLPASALQATRS